jgi:hypothetical protein
MKSNHRFIGTRETTSSLICFDICSSTVPRHLWNRTRKCADGALSWNTHDRHVRRWTGWMSLLSGATGNVATEDVQYAQRESPYMVEGDVDVEQVALVRQWISEQLGRESASRAGKAILGKLKKKRLEK